MSNVVQTIENAAVATPVDGAGSLMRLIERAAMSPDFDVQKLEKLFEVMPRKPGRHLMKLLPVRRQRSRPL